MTTYSPRWSGDTKNFPGTVEGESAREPAEKTIGKTIGKTVGKTVGKEAEKPESEPKTPVAPVPSPREKAVKTPAEGPVAADISPSNAAEKPDDQSEPSAVADAPINQPSAEPAASEAEPRHRPGATAGGARRHPEFALDAMTRRVATGLARGLDRVIAKQREGDGQEILPLKKVAKLALAALLFLILIEQFTDVSIGTILLNLIIFGGIVVALIVYVSRSDLPLRQMVRTAFPVDGSLVIGPVIDKLIGNAAEDMMPEICESKGDMAYLADVTDEFDARKFNLSGIFAAFHTFPRSFDMKRSSYVFSDLLEGRYEGLTFAVVNTDIRQGWTSAGQNASARLFTGFLLRIQSPRPFAGRIPLRPSAGDNTSGVDDAAFDPDWVGTFFDVGPEDIEKGLETILEGKDFNAVLYGNEFLLAVETHERLFWPRGNHTVDGTRRKLQRDADIAIRIIDLLGWHGDTCDLDWWQPSWTRLHATREVVRQAGEQRQHADNARQVESDRLAAIIENADGTFSVGSRTYKSRSSAEAYLDLIERTQKWAETE